MKNANGYGTVVNLDKSGKKRRRPWAVRVTVGRTAEGKPILKYLGYYSEQKEAQLALAKYHINSLDADASTITFKEVYDLWFEERGSKLTDKNQVNYVQAYKHVSSITNKKMRDLKTSHLQRVIDSMSQKASSKNKVKTLINKVYLYALENDLVLKNYAEFLNVNDVQEESGKVFTREEIAKLWELSKTNQLAEDIVLFFYLGVRASEGVSITTNRIFLEERYIDLNGTKTKAAKRLIPIHEDIVPILEKRMHQKRLIVTKNGKAYTYDWFRKQFRELMEELNFDHTIHDTRKTLVTLLHESGVTTEDIAFIVGHSQQGVTAKVYMKVNIEHLISSINNLKIK